MEFLEYAYLQRGEDTQAQAILEEAAHVRASDVNPAYPLYYDGVQARLPALLALETGNWEAATALGPDAAASTYAQGMTLLAHAIAAGHLHDSAAGRAAQDSYETLLAKETLVPPGGSLDTLHQEIRAWAELAQGNTDRALALLEPVSNRQARVGKGEVELPAGEMRADMLMMSGKPREALALYQQSLQTDPGRLNTLLGAARAAEKSSQLELARRYYSDAVAQAGGSTAARLQTAHAFLEHTPGVKQLTPVATRTSGVTTTPAVKRAATPQKAQHSSHSVKHATKKPPSRSHKSDKHATSDKT